MLQGILTKVSLMLVAEAVLVLAASGSEIQPSATQTETTTSSIPRPLESEPAAVKFWRENWLWFLIGFLFVIVPIIIWAIVGPGRRWYQRRKRRNSVPILWNKIGQERFHNPESGYWKDMRETRQISRSRGSGSSTRSDLALSSNAAAPGEQDVEAGFTSIPSAYVQRERRRTESNDPVIGLFQPQSLMPPLSNSSDRGSYGSLGPPDPRIHRVHPAANTFQRLSRQSRSRRRHASMPMVHSHVNPAFQRADVSHRESIQAPSAVHIPQRKSLPSLPSTPTTPRHQVQANTGLPRIPLPIASQYMQQESMQGHHGTSMHNRSTSWHHPSHHHHRQSSQQTSFQQSRRHASIGGYQEMPEIPLPPTPTATVSQAVEPRRSISRGKLQKPQHLNPRYSQQTNQPERSPRDPEPQMSFYRTPSSSQENTRLRPFGILATTSAPSPAIAAAPIAQPSRPNYPIRSALANKSTSNVQNQDRIYGTESGYTFSISGGGQPDFPPAKSVKFAPIPQSTGIVPGRFPIRNF